MAARGVVALLVGQLLGSSTGASLEPALRLGSLQLLLLLVLGQPARITQGAGLGAALRVVAACLRGRGEPEACCLGLQLLQELACSRAVRGPCVWGGQHCNRAG